MSQKENIYLVRTELYNIQSHKHTIIEWDKGLNVIVGPSDSGKTAIQRGLNWNLYNESGNDLIRYKDNGETDKKGKQKKENLAYITNEYSNGVIVTRKFDKSKNIYEIIDENGEFYEFDGFRNDIPELVSKLTGISPMKITEDLNLNLNIVPSRGKSLIDYNGAEKAQIIGAYAQANVIDVAIKNVQADMKRTNLQINNLEKEIKSLNEEIEKMGNIEEKEKIIEEIDNLYFSLSEENFIKNELLELKKSINEKINVIKTDKKFLNSCKDLDKQELNLLKTEQVINDIRFKIKDIIDKRNRLIAIKNRIIEKQNEIEKAKKTLEETKDIDKQENELLKIEIEISNLQKEINSINETRKNLVNLNKNIKYRKNEITKDKEIIKKYKDIDKEEKTLEEISFAIEEYKFMILEQEQKKEKLLKLRESINTRLENRKKGAEFLKKKDKEIKVLINECVELIRKMGKCPVCMSKLDEKHLENIKKELEEM